MKIINRMIKSRLACFLISLMFFPVLLAACSQPPVLGDREEMQIEPIDCVVALPVVISADKPSAVIQSQELEKGAGYIDNMMAVFAGSNRKIHLPDTTDLPSLSSGINKGKFGFIAALGERSGCRAVLYITLRQFRQRQGTEMAVGQPASAAFEMTLLEVPSARVLWASEFRETQQPFLANIFSSKMGSRGLRWITVEELVRQGLEERLAACPYLK